MRIKEKYQATTTEKQAVASVALLSKAEAAFHNQCCFLIMKAYEKATAEKKWKPSWNEVTLTRHLKKHIRLSIKEACLQFFVAPEYPEDDEEIEDGVKDSNKEIMFDLIFSSFTNLEQHYYGVEAKIILVNNFLKRKASSELAEYISTKGMRKFIDGIYKKRGCMVGYLVEGKEVDVVRKINARITSDSNYAKTEILVKNVPNTQNVQYYESTHTNYQGNPLRHFILNLAMLN